MKNDLQRLAYLGTSTRKGPFRRSWDQLYQRASRSSRENTYGVDGTTLADYRVNLESRLGMLVTLVREREFEFSALRPILIKKKSGKDRLICIPTVEDRLVQKAVQILLTDDRPWKYAAYNGVNFGFVAGKGTKHAVRKALAERLQRPFVYKTDISAFFDNIDRKELKSLVTSKLRSRTLHELVCASIDCEIAPVTGNYRDRIQKLGIRPGRGVRQGMPLSPLFANLYLADFDRLVVHRGIRCIRYADDLIFFGESLKECERIHHFCTEELGKIGLEIPTLESKTKSEIVAPGEAVDFLGICIEPDHEGGYQATIPEQQKDAIKSNIMSYGDINFLADNQITFSNYVSKLQSTVDGYAAAYSDCIDVNDLLRDIRNYYQAALRKLFMVEFKLDWDRLGPKQKRLFDLTRGRRSDSET